MRFFVYGFVLMMFVGYIPNVQAECSGVCAQYCEQGYCTDYIEHRLGVRQSGNANQWIGNISADQVQSGDVAIFDFGSYGHVAVVESVDDDLITISEWNWGVNYVNRFCGVTDEFGKLHNPYRTVSKSTVTRFWRPNLSDDSTPIQLTIRQVDEYGWYPPNVDCFDAVYWFEILPDRCVQRTRDICFELQGTCPAIQ